MTEVNGESTRVVDVVAEGDLVVRIHHEVKGVPSAASFRVDSSTLRSQSKYFERLLNPSGFGEAAAIQTRHEALKQQHRPIAEIPAEELPVVTIHDVGHISEIKSLAALCTDFFSILHGLDELSNPPVANLANLGIVADRFDALHAVARYVRRRKWIQTINAKTVPKVDMALTEEKVRQRLLVATMLDYPPWVEKYSIRLILKGWVGQERDMTAALWWDLPRRMEEELVFRRECVLETIQSLQTYFLALYTSRERQCKLGYDSSAQCDSFQLGEMVRFFSRVRTLRLQGAIIDVADPPAPYQGDIQILLDNLRQAPEYQVDRNHTHCGLRTRIMPLLDLMADCCLSIGICADCWADDRAQYAWMDAKRPLVWKRSAFSLRSHLSLGHRNKHADLRAMFMATERDWS